ncbi:MAG TPA: hypothetical protein VF691_23240 [Cytophagaceae bacterium]|jgi:hypothetical protein
MKLTQRFILLFWACLILSSTAGYTQQALDEKAVATILDKAMGTVGMEDPDLAFTFEGIAFGIQDPVKIFSMPVYEVHRGGYMYCEGRKFEMQLGIMKALCDGKLMVIIDEKSKMMVIDSLRDHVPGFKNENPDREKMLAEFIGEGKLSYVGKQKVNGRECHKIKADIEGGDATHILYWVDVKTEKLLLMAEYQNKAYDVYWIKKISKAPKGYVYAVNVPKKETEKLYGYEVFDMRFVSEDLYKNK